MTCWCEGKCPYIETPRKLAEAGNHSQAHLELRRVLVNAPFCAEANIAIAIILTKGNHPEQAKVHIDRAAKAGETVRIKYERGSILRVEGYADEAAAEFAAAQKLEPDNPTPVAALIGSLELGGHIDEALEVANAARARFPTNIYIRRQSAIAADASKDYGGAIEILQGDNLEPLEYLDRGRAKEKNGDYAGAWGDWMEGKRLCREKLGHRYDPQRFKTIFANLRQAALAPKPSFITPAPVMGTSPTPIFVTGFPRSGTTMMETVLSSHSAVVAGDEMMGITEVVEAIGPLCKARMPYPAAMMATTLGENAGVPELLRDMYMNVAKQRLNFTAWSGKARPSKKRPRYFTDKMPINEIHIPLIRMLFPDAPVIVMHRHPLDVMVSCMGHWLANGGFYGSSLESCASHYLQIDQLTQFYWENLPKDQRRWVPVAYENFVADPHTVTDMVLDYVGLGMEPACIDFHKNKRNARTLSYNQVRQPLHDKSIGRWKNFRDQLAPAIEILRPIIEREGHEL